MPSTATIAAQNAPCASAEARPMPVPVAAFITPDDRACRARRKPVRSDRRVETTRGSELRLFQGRKPSLDALQRLLHPVVAVLRLGAALAEQHDAQVAVLPGILHWHRGPVG